MLLSVLCAAAFGPVLAAATGVTGAVAVASIGVLGSAGSGVLSDVLIRAADRLRSLNQTAKPAEGLEAEIAQQIERILDAGGETAQALRADIAAVLRQINASEIILLEAIETGNEDAIREVLAVADQISAGFGEMGFLLRGLAKTAREIQDNLGKQRAENRVTSNLIHQQLTASGLALELMTVIELRTRNLISGGTGAPSNLPRWVHGPPYLGLVPYDESHAQVFYGRERMTAELAVKLTETGFVVVTGASGAGKSSLLRAGLVPALARGKLVPGSGRWLCKVITPTEDPLTELAAHIAALDGSDFREIRKRLAETPDQAHVIFRQAIVAGATRGGGHQTLYDIGRMILIVDQFEQVFTAVPHDGSTAERHAYITALCAAATRPTGPNGKPPALVVLAVRGDFWDRCAAHPELSAALDEGQFVVGPMTDSDMRLAITGPAEAAGLHIEDALADVILSELRTTGQTTSAGVLPLLSQAMLLTWENREGSRLTSRGYRQAGGVAHAVQISADAVYDVLPSVQQTLAREMLRKMIVIGSDQRLGRRRLSTSDLHAGYSDTESRQLDEVLEAFAAKRLIVLNDGTAEIAHDVLLDAWPRLRGWLEEDKTSWVLYSQLVEDATTWRDTGEDPSFLYRGTQLAALQQETARWSIDSVRYPTLSDTTRSFLSASYLTSTRGIRRRRMAVIALVVLFIASLAGGATAALSARQANREHSLAVSGQLAAESEVLDSSDPVTASLLSAAAWDIARTPRAAQSMLNVLAQPVRAVLPSPGGAVSAVAFSPDGRIMAAASSTGNNIRFWNVAARRQIGMPLPVSGAGAVAFSPDGKFLATGSDVGAQLWSVATHRRIGSPLPVQEVDAIAFSPDGRMLATAGNGGTATLWDVATHRSIGSPLPVQEVDTIAFSPDGRMLATAGIGSTATVWDVATRQQTGSPLPVQGVGAVAFSPDGKTLATEDLDSTARLWDVTTHLEIGQPLIASAGVPASIFSAAFSPDGNILATAGNKGIQLWDLNLHVQLSVTSPTSDGAMAFSPDGKTIAIAGDNSGLSLLDLTINQRSGFPLVVQPKVSGASSMEMAFSPDGRILATAFDGLVRLWDPATRRKLGPPLPVSGAADVAFSPDGKIIATSDTDGIQLWDLATRHRLGRPLPFPGALTAAFSPDGKILAVVDANGTHLWNLATHRQLGRTLPGSADAIRFSTNGKIVVTSNENGTINLIDTATRRSTGRIAGIGEPLSMAFKPHSTTLATIIGPVNATGGTVQLWDATTHQRIGAPWAAMANNTSAVAFSPDGMILATGDDDGRAKLWDVATQQQIGAPLLVSDGGPINNIAFNSAGTILAIAIGNTVQLWNVAVPSNLLSAVCEIANRSMTTQEWNQYAAPEPYRQVCR